MILDIIIIILLISAVLRGKEIGFVQQAFSTVGFFGGLLIGALIEPYTVSLAHTQLSRSIVTLVTTLGMAFVLLTVGEYVGIFLKRKVIHLKIDKLDNILGSLISIVSVLIGVWLGVAILRTLPYISFQNDIKSSKIIAALDRNLPPAPNIIADLTHLVDPNGFPRVFNGNEPVPSGSVKLPAYSTLAAAINKDRPSVVKIVGDGCGGIVEGSGFVVKNNMVATNAHVVAGISQPYVEDANGNHIASVVYFNPNLDFALLRVSNLAGKPLDVSDQIAQNNTPAAALGYPGGGNFKADQAVVMSEFNATGSNIYAQGNTNRKVYEIEADIIPGNSGGPLITTKGLVIGVVFAQSTEYNNVGYALVSNPIVSIIHNTSANSHPVSTGNCAE
jgi:S1-C subfamily serine protease